MYIKLYAKHLESLGNTLGWNPGPWVTAPSTDMSAKCQGFSPMGTTSDMVRSWKKRGKNALHQHCCCPLVEVNCTFGSQALIMCKQFGVFFHNYPFCNTVFFPEWLTFLIYCSLKMTVFSLLAFNHVLNHQNPLALQLCAQCSSCGLGLGYKSLWN